MAAQIVEVGVGGAEVADGLGGGEGRQPVLPVLMAALDLALGLRGGRGAEVDVVEVESVTELGPGARRAGKEDGVVIDIEFQRQAEFEEGAWEEVQVGEKVFGGINASADAAAAAIVEHVEQRTGWSAWKPTMRSGIELPQGADLRALPAAHGSLWSFGRLGWSEAVGQGEAADGGRIKGDLAAAQDFAGGEAVAGGRAGAEELAQERLDLCGPGRRMVAARSARLPEVAAPCRAGAEIVPIEFVKARAAQSQSLRARAGGQFAGPEGAEDFADERSAQAGGELGIRFFTARSMCRHGPGWEARSDLEPAAWRPPLRSGPQAAGSKSECPGLLATRQGKTKVCGVAFNRGERRALKVGPGLVRY